MLLEYIKCAMELATYEIIEDDRTYYGKIAGFDGLWANAKTLEACRNELQETLEEWILLSLRLNKPVPTVHGIDLSVKSVA